MNSQDTALILKPIDRGIHKGDRCGFCGQVATCSHAAIGGGRCKSAKYLPVCSDCAGEIAVMIEQGSE